jgi:cytidine deaminase
MKEKNLNIQFKEFNKIEELTPEDADLLETARRASKNAYAPYSGFQVGAVVQLENHFIVEGNNQENAAYPSGLCAERVALFAASAQFPGIPVIAIAITAKSADFLIDYPVTPCGACRQVMAEYENHHHRPIRLILAGETGKIMVFENIASLLPFGFDSSHLRPKH